MLFPWKQWKPSRYSLKWLLCGNVRLKKPEKCTQLMGRHTVSKLTPMVCDWTTHAALLLGYTGLPRRNITCGWLSAGVFLAVCVSVWMKGVGVPTSCQAALCFNRCTGFVNERRRPSRRWWGIPARVGMWTRLRSSNTGSITILVDHHRRLTYIHVSEYDFICGHFQHSPQTANARTKLQHSWWDSTCHWPYKAFKKI